MSPGWGSGRVVVAGSGAFGVDQEQQVGAGIRPSEDWVVMWCGGERAARTERVRVGSEEGFAGVWGATTPWLDSAGASRWNEVSELRAKVGAAQGVEAVLVGEQEGWAVTPSISGALADGRGELFAGRGQGRLG